MPAAQLALVALLQTYTGTLDDEAIEALSLNRRWQLVCAGLDSDGPPFSKATLARFRAALDSSPLWGAGRIEDTYNLVGHAVRKTLSVIARQQGRGLAAMASAAGAKLVTASSLKAALDLDWNDPTEQQRALELVLSTLEAVEGWMAAHPEIGAAPPVRASRSTGTSAMRCGIWTPGWCGRSA